MNDRRNYIRKIPDKSLLGQYLTWIDDKFKNKAPLYKEYYESLVREENDFRGKNAPFLSVITRTQGKRPEMLRETLLCLAGQKEQDFEVLLIGHKLNEEQRKVVTDILEEQPEFMHSKIRFYTLNRGNRTAPLNFGFAHARGAYISILDDDDIVMDNWVSAFKNTAKNNPWVMLFSPVYYQDWMLVNTQSDIFAPRAYGKPIYNMFSLEFDVFQQMRYNNCPFTGFAFPAYLFQKLGLIFDETLSTTEDWDYIMQCVFISGIKDTGEETSIYRYWANAETSKTDHAKEEWDKNFYKIIDKFKNAPVLIHTDFSDSLARETMLYGEMDGWKYRTPEISRAALYIDYGSGFNQEDIIEAKFLSNSKLFDVVFNLPKEKRNNIKGLRFDPGDDGFIKLRNVMMLLKFEDGSSEVLHLSEAYTNGLTKGNSVFFLKNDPWIVWKKTLRELKKVRVIGDIAADISSDEIMAELR